MWLLAHPSWAPGLSSHPLCSRAPLGASSWLLVSTIPPSGTGLPRGSSRTSGLLSGPPVSAYSFVFHRVLPHLHHPEVISGSRTYLVPSLCYPCASLHPPSPTVLQVIVPTSVSARMPFPPGSLPCLPIPRSFVAFGALSCAPICHLGTSVVHRHWLRPSAEQVLPSRWYQPEHFPPGSVLHPALPCVSLECCAEIPGTLSEPGQVVGLGQSIPAALNNF